MYPNDLEQILEDASKERDLFGELDRTVTAGSAVLVWTRVVPHYKYAERATSAEWFGIRHGDGAERMNRWSRLAGKFGLFLLRDTNSNSNSFSDVLVGDRRRDAVPHAQRGIQEAKEAMQEEASVISEPSVAAANVISELSRDLERGALRAEKAQAMAVTRLRKCAGLYFKQVWEKSTPEECLQLHALATGGVVNSRRPAAVSSLVNRGIVEVEYGTGVAQLRSRAFREFIEHDINRNEVEAWRKEGHDGGWRLIGPPLAVTFVLGLAFLAMANPEVRTTLYATLLGLLPMLLPLFRSGQSSGSPGTSAT